MCNISIWLNSGLNGCVQYHLAQNRSNGCVTTCITHWHIGGEIGKLDTLQQYLLTACSLQFAWFTVDHNSTVFGQLQPITISVLFELKLRKLNSEANTWQSLWWVHHPQFCSTWYVLYTLLAYSKHINVLYYNDVCHKNHCSGQHYYLHTELVKLNLTVQIQHINNNYSHPWLQWILRGVPHRSIICEV